MLESVLFNSLPKYVITLRPDRVSGFVQSAALAGVENYQFIPGVKDSNPVKGCRMAHINVIKKARELNLPQVAIFEDDCRFKEGFLEAVDALNPFEMLYLGANHHKKPLWTKEGWICQYALSTVGYVVDQCLYELIISFVDDPAPIDMIYVQKLQKVCPIHCLWPNMVYQQSGYSDIKRKWVNYDKYYRERES